LGFKKLWECRKKNVEVQEEKRRGAGRKPTKYGDTLCFSEIVL